jgi:uncharacterized protein (TIGR03435 family)
MSRRMLFAAFVVLTVFAHPRVHAKAPQAAAPTEFDVVSIKRNTNPGSGGGMRSLPDGTFMMMNQPMATLIGNASPVPGILFRNIIGLPGWAQTENYDVTAKPPAGTTREQMLPMWQALFADRMKLVAHVEQREATTFALVMARSDGRLGPALKKASLDCSQQSAPQPSAQGGPPDFANRCGMMASGTAIISGGMTMDMFARNLSGRAGGPVTNRTGLEGNYALTLNFSPPAAASAVANPGDAPDFFTALQEQLGLKLQPEKGTVPYFVIDHIERPTDD